MKWLSKIIIGLASIISLFTFLSLSTPTPTYAKDGSCWSGANTAMRAACDSSVEHGAGAAWINGSKWYSTSEETVIDNPDSSSATVYLHGALWDAASAYWYDAQIWAVNTQLCTGLSYNDWDIHSSWSNQCNGKSHPNYIKSYSNTFFRGYAKWGWSDGQGDRSGQIDIDLKAFKKASSHTSEGGYDKYTAKLWVARCANTNGSGDCQSSYAADESTITIRIKKAQFVSKSSISVTQQGGATKTVNTKYSSNNSNSTEANSKEFTFSGGSDIFTFKTTNTIKRTSDSSDNTIKVQYQKWTHSNATQGSYDAAATHSLKSGKEWVVSNSTDQTTLKSIEIKPGQSKKVCTKIKLWRSTSINNGVASFSNALTPTSEACITVIHKATAKYRSKSELKITYNGTEVFNKGSGWNKTDKDLKLVLANSKVGDTIKFTATNTIERTDTNSSTAIKTRYRKWNYDSTSFDSFTEVALKSNKTKIINDKNITKTIKKNGTKICAHIALSRKTTVTNVDGEKKEDFDSITKPNSKICVTVSSAPVKDPDVDMGFIGETTKVSGGSGYDAYDAYASFFVDPSVDPSDRDTNFNSSSSGETSPHFTYNSGWVRQSTMADPGDRKKLLYDGTNSLLGLYSGVRKTGSPTNAQSSNSFTINVPDDTSYTGAKVCVAGVKNRTPEHTIEERTIHVSRTCSRQGAAIKDDKGNITGYETEYYDCSYSYKEYKHTFKYYWDYSAPSCKPIAQKPNFRVTGNTLYSAGNIAGIVANKTTGRHYSSWSEYLTIAGGTTSSFGSGAAYRNGASSPSDDLNDELTIANDTSSKGGAGIDGSASGAFVESIKNIFTKDGQGNEGVVTNHFKSLVYNGDKTLTNGDLGWIDGSKTNIIIVNGDLNIAAEVSNINAWVIVDGKLNTCDGKSPKQLATDDPCNNSSLKITGLAYAQEFVLSRTKVGAGSREKSTLSAETVELPASSFINSYNEALDSTKGPTAVYTQELAPRI